MSIHDFDAKRREQTLDQLEGFEWGPATYDSYLVKTCHRLRKKPIGEFSVEDLRIMIGQKIGLMFLVPPALERLVDNPLSEGDFYPGDLLCSLLRVDSDFWLRHDRLKSRLDKVISKLVEVPSLIADDLREFQRRTAL
jgi:hypothetical protein